MGIHPRMRSCVLAATVQNTVKPFVLTYIGNKWGMAMDTKRFDQITKLFAARRTRRAAISSTAGLAATAAIAPRLGHVSAQEATPTGADEVTISTEPHPGAGIPSKPTFLFVQPFEGGTWAPKPGENGVFSLTLTGMAAQTVYFSDRPDRIFGVTSLTAQTGSSASGKLNASSTTSASRQTTRPMPRSSPALMTARRKSSSSSCSIPSMTPPLAP